MPALAIFWAWIALLLTSYCLPWVMNVGNGLTINAYDLAEWASLSPTVRAQPLLYTALFLRLPLVMLTGFIALVAPPRFNGLWLYHAAICFLLVMAQLPPLEFLNQLNDPNYQQQFALALVSSIIAVIGLSGGLQPIRFLLMVGMTLVTGITLAVGYGQAIRVMQSLHLPAAIGVGFVGMLGLWSLWLVYSGVQLITRHRAASPPP